MKIISNLIISFIELMEAEGRVAKRNVMLLIKSFILLYFATLFIFLAAVIALAVLYVYVKENHGFYVAAPLISLLFCLIGLFLMSKITAKKDSAKESQEE